DGRGSRHQRGPAAAAPWLADLSLLKRLADVGTAGRQALELHQLYNQIGSPGPGRLLQQGLLGADVEWRDLGDGVDQHLVIQLPYRIPVDRQAQRIAESPRFALDFRPLDQCQG